MPGKEIKVTPGYRSDGDAFLLLSEWIPRGEKPWEFDVNEIAEYILRYLPDTNEVVLIKGDEILYSEVVS